MTATPSPTAAPTRAPGRALSRRYATVVTRFRWLALALVGAVTALAVVFLPSLGTSGGGLSNLVGTDDPAVAAQVDAVERFGFPLLSRTAVVQRNPDGLGVYTRARVPAAAPSPSTSRSSSSPGSPWPPAPGRCWWPSRGCSARSGPVCRSRCSSRSRCR
ncbi:MAG TPA: hypothetical protein VM367_00210 [Pseudonocardia sp.]|nr:hypothetical protein [Pseudonocardia sp.]